MKTLKIIVVYLTICCIAFCSFVLADTQITPDLLSDASSDWCDHFTGSSPDPLWSFVREDPTHWSLTESPGNLRITIQHGDLYAGWNDNENTLLRSAPSGDFELITRVTITPTLNYQQAGLVIYQDDNNYIRLTRLWNSGEQIQMLKEENGNVVSFEVDSTQKTVFLSIIKKGNTYTGYWSADGSSWNQVNQYTDVNFHDLKIGLLAFHAAGNTQIPADFDFFCVIPTVSSSTPSPMPTAVQTVIPTPVVTGTSTGVLPQSTVAPLQGKITDLRVTFTIDKTGDLFITDYSNGTVIKVTSGGVQSIYASGIDKPRYPVFDSSGNLYVGAFDGTIQKISPDGKKQVIASGIWSPQGMGIDGAGILYVAGGYDGQIHMITPSGSIASMPSGVKNPKHLVVSNAGDIYYTDDNGKIILHITPDKNRASLANIGETIKGMAIEGDIIYVSYRDTIAQIDPFGTVTPVVQNLDTPTSIAVRNGAIYGAVVGGTYLLSPGGATIMLTPTSVTTPATTIPTTVPTTVPTGTQTAGPVVPTSSGYREATISHSGFDFSEGKNGEYPTYDGELISWQPDGATHPDYPRDTDYLWWRNTHLDTETYATQTKDMGKVALSSVREVPARWDTSPLIPPLLTGHTIVAKCNDGYVKFQVISIDPVDWTANVRYWYSTGKTFDDPVS